MTKPIDALKTIARYVEAKKPKTLAEAEHMLDLISVMADETILDEDAAESRGGRSAPVPAPAQRTDAPRHSLK
jgi:hypothetical protein